MFPSSPHRFFGPILTLVLLVMSAAPTAASHLTNDQQACVNTLNKSGQKVAATQGKENSSCVKDAGKGKLIGMTADECLTADRKSKMAKAEAKTVDGQTKRCGFPFPAYGYAGAAAVNISAKSEELALVNDIFGAPLAPVIMADKEGATCQAVMTKTYEKLGAIYLKTYNACKKTGFKDSTITSAPALELCLGQDPKNKISKAAGKILTSLDKKCVGVNLASAFPGVCAGQAGSNATFAVCVKSSVVCRMCLAVNAMDAISRGCDDLDDGALNASCRQCGNSATEAPEECDDGGESAVCDADCTLAQCGDGNTNSSAGEECDDANASDNDTCPTTCLLAACGDGFVCSAGGCTSGPAGGAEECDDGLANSDVTPDACRTDCANPSCGDGVIDTGEDCDDSGESAVCDADCTLVQCGDGTTNISAGEECDDANASDNDPCLTTCLTAACGDGFVCSVGGCTSGPAGGAEECDDGLANSDVTPDACRTNCANPSCGDGVIDGGEFCDEAGSTATCDGDCTAPACGDGFFNAAAGEECDGGGETASCDADCTNRVCGDGTLNVTAGEECDDGNTIAGDGCNATCLCGPGSGEVGCQDSSCPDRGQLVLFAATTGVACTTNGDCSVGACDTGLGVCITATELDTGWTGIAHDADVNDQVLTKGRLLCEGPFNPLSSEPCGVCEVLGLDPSTGDCRCSNDNRKVCDQPFQNDANDCGGNVCNCYFGAPLPLSSGNTPACVVNRFFDDVGGTANVDLGEGQINANLRSVVFLGENVLAPCPACGGTCTAPPAKVGMPCGTDVDCETTPLTTGDGVCSNYDSVAGDGIRGGTCWKGDNQGESCDVGAYNENFPASPSGGGAAGSSLDCFPDTGLNVSGGGLRIGLVQTTGTTALPPAAVGCGLPQVAEICPCGVCSSDNGVTCTSNADCTGIGTCGKDTNATIRPNQCADSICTDVGGGEGECLANPPDSFCDGVVRANGKGFIQCISTEDCAALGPDAGSCALTSARECFFDPISATGVMNPNFPVAVAAFCIPRTSNGGINTVAGLPGPGRVKNAAHAKTYCASNPAVQYTPGSGGCP